MRTLTCLLPFLAVMAAPVVSLGDTIIPGGDVYGIWSPAGSPYRIQGDIGVPSDSTLVIEPGVQAIFDEACGLTVTGALNAVGTAQDSITFTAPDGDEWNGIHVEEVAGPVHLSHCIVERGAATGSRFNDGGGLWVASSSTTIANSTFRHNRAAGWGGAVYLHNGLSAPPATMTDCLFGGNHAVSNGGGLYFSGQGVELTGCRFVDNTTDSGGGGVYCEPYLFGSVLIDACSFESNEATWHGGGLLINGPAGNGVTVSDCGFTLNRSGLKGGGIHLMATEDVTIGECVFSQNESSDQGSGMYASSATTTTTGSTFDRNHAGSAGALCCDGQHAEIVSCTFSGNWASGDGMDLRLTGNTASLLNTVVSGNTLGWPFASIYCGTGTFSIEYCDLFPRDSGDCAGPGVPAGLGDIVGVNALGDPCDAYSNILLDPHFCDMSSDLRIAQDSPCLGAGEGGGDIGAHGIGCETLVEPTSWGRLKAMFRWTSRPAETSVPEPPN